MKRTVFLRYLAGAILSLGSTFALADNYPSKPIKAIVPFAPGSATDQIGRAFAAKMAESLGQPVVIENRPGANGMIGADVVAKSPADGYTLLFGTNSTNAALKSLVKNLPYNQDTAFTPIGYFGSVPLIVAINNDVPAKSLNGFVSIAKANPGKLSFGSSGSGSSDHLATEIFWQQTGTSGIHVPYKGGGPAITDAVGGQLDALFANVNSVIQFIRVGKLRVLAVAGTKQSPVLPNVPTFAELGYKDIVAYSWQAVVAPKGLPTDVKAKIYKAVIAGLNDPQNKKNFTELGYEIVANSPEQFVQYQAQENQRWQKLIESRNITAN